MQQSLTIKDIRKEFKEVKREFKEEFLEDFKEVKKEIKEEVEEALREITREVVIEAASDISKLWRAIVDNNNIEKSGDVWTITGGILWYGRISSLYICQDYGRLFQKLKTNKNMLLYGTPGIGKSAFLNYVLVQIALQETNRDAKIIYTRK